MVAPWGVIDIPIEEDLARLELVARSRTEPASWVQRARILLAYRADPSAHAVGQAIGVTHQTVLRCLGRAVRLGVMAALDDSPRPGKTPEITADAKTWLVSLACQKAKDLGYPHELWTTRLLARHVCEHAVAAGHPCMASIVQGTVCKILARHDVKPHKVRDCLERRDEAFETKMAEVLCIYREFAVLRAAGFGASSVAIISYDEKPGIQAIGNTAPDLPPKPRAHATFARDHEYQRHGTLSLLARIDLLSGKVHACVEDRHRSREFVSFFKRRDEAYPADTAIKLILDNHSAHISKETKAWLATRPEGRFTFVFTPKHGSWLNLVEGLFSKMACSLLRHIGIESKSELKARILAYLRDINSKPVSHTWTYKIGEAA